MNGSPGVGQISQSITVPEDGDYKLTFYYAGNFLGNDHNKKDMIFNLGSSVSGTVTGEYGGNELEPTWKQFTATYTLDAGQLNLVFSSSYYANEYGGPALDNVSLTLVPEPYHYGLAVEARALFVLSCASLNLGRSPGLVEGVCTGCRAGQEECDFHFFCTRESRSEGSNA